MPFLPASAATLALNSNAGLNHSRSSTLPTQIKFSPTANRFPKPCKNKSRVKRPTSPITPITAIKVKRSTLGRRMRAVTREEISDLPIDTQDIILRYSKKYQQKAATLFRVLRQPHARKLSATTHFKPCTTCASQDWPCVLTINGWGMKKQIGRCVGCRHTRSTCSLKYSAKDWAEGDPKPWDEIEIKLEEISGRPKSDIPMPRLTPNPMGISRLLATEPNCPVLVGLPASVDADISQFLSAVTPRLHTFSGAVSSAIAALAIAAEAECHPPATSPPCFPPKPLLLSAGVISSPSSGRTRFESSPALPKLQSLSIIVSNEEEDTCDSPLCDEIKTPPTPTKPLHDFSGSLLHSSSTSTGRKDLETSGWGTPPSVKCSAGPSTYLSRYSYTSHYATSHTRGSPSTTMELSEVDNGMPLETSAWRNSPRDRFDAYWRSI